MKSKEQIRKGCGKSWKDTKNGIFCFCIGVGKARVLCPTCKTLLNQINSFEEIINKRFPECSCFRNEIEKVICHKCYFTKEIEG